MAAYVTTIIIDPSLMTLNDSGHPRFSTFQVDHRGGNACRVPFSPLRQIPRNFCSLGNQGKIALTFTSRESYSLGRHLNISLSVAFYTFIQQI